MELLPGTWMRGGTSKCWLFKASELRIGELLPSDRALEQILVGAFGSGDSRQINGIGGGTSTSSKAAIVRRSTRDGVDVEYLFAQVGTDVATVDWTSNCGNCASAIALYALEEGMAAVGADGRSTVRLLNLNTGDRLDAVISTPGAVIPVSGAATIPGVVGSGVTVQLLFRDVAGGTTGKTLPTGSPIDSVAARQRTIDVSYVDAGAPAMVLRATDFDLVGTELPDQLSEVSKELIALRAEGAERIGLLGPRGEVPEAIPKVGVVAAPGTYMSSAGERIDASSYDLAARMISMGAWHPVIGITSVIALTVAAYAPGTIVNQLVRPSGGQGTLRIGTPGGVVVSSLRREPGGGELVGAVRTARRLANAAVFVGRPVARMRKTAKDRGLVMGGGS